MEQIKDRDGDRLIQELKDSAFRAYQANLLCVALQGIDYIPDYWHWIEYFSPRRN